MVNKAYNKGRNLEYIICGKLRDLGYTFIRSAGSHSPIDIIAGLRGSVLAIQCKRGAYLRPTEKEGLIKSAYDFGAIPCYTEMVNGIWRVKDLNGEFVI